MSAASVWRGGGPLLPLLPLAAWLLGALATATVLAETLLQEAHWLFAFARLAAYASSLMAGAFLVGLLALFGLACGAMLWWLDDLRSPLAVFRAICSSSWAYAAYTWAIVALLLLDLPAPLTAADLENGDQVQARLDSLLAYRWMGELYYAGNGAFLLLAVVLIARAAKPVNAVLAVGFAAGVIYALFAGLGALMGDAQGSSGQ